MTDQTVPHVYTALSEVFKTLSVGKDGRLPSNMGGGGYQTAEAVSEAVRNEFAQHDLIILSNEEETSRESIIHKERLNFSSSVTGTYTIVSTRDGSMTQISGVGHGLATGTAVAANVASTFALKNALMRTFMVSENAVEEGGLAGENTAKPKPENRATRNVKAATTKPAPKATPGGSSGEAAAKTKIQAEYIKTGLITSEYANERRDFFKADGSKTPLQDLLKEIESGDLGNA